MRRWGNAGGRNVQTEGIIMFSFEVYEEQNLVHESLIHYGLHSGNTAVVCI